MKTYFVMNYRKNAGGESLGIRNRTRITALLDISRAANHYALRLHDLLAADDLFLHMILQGSKAISIALPARLTTHSFYGLREKR